VFQSLVGKLETAEGWKKLGEIKVFQSLVGKLETSSL